ncbi:hypothetical protein J5I95_13845 [Candidatus Poribacteria bacterium]|nr:hypothetical protein [Candidatus Poribacteria bacterium]
MMVTEFQIMDAVGNALANGEIDGDIYRVFSKELLGGCMEFESLKEMLAECGGIGIQPQLFETPAGTQQMSLFQNKTENE